MAGESVLVWIIEGERKVFRVVLGYRTFQLLARGEF